MQQREIIRKSFKTMEEDSTRNGLSIFIRLLSEYPEYKTIWPQFRSIPDSSLISSDALKRHAIVYMGGLRQIVESMDDDQKLAEQAYAIAKSHVKWGIQQFHIEVN
ncbi:unnamed protein product [Toxocara canis]|uniref:GLOBIN domain-containing protein n=1 Tax=Toxocara canis TaxID=6265 RepID=A0A183VBE5_TOXCA|nr:unnamed protein product [Toxocara canis]